MGASTLPLGASAWLLYETLARAPPLRSISRQYPLCPLRISASLNPLSVHAQLLPGTSAPPIGSPRSLGSVPPFQVPRSASSAGSLGCAIEKFCFTPSRFGLCPARWEPPPRNWQPQLRSALIAELFIRSPHLGALAPYQTLKPSASLPPPRSAPPRPPRPSHGYAIRLTTPRLPPFAPLCSLTVSAALVENLYLPLFRPTCRGLRPHKLAMS